MNGSNKILPTHRQRQAVVYLRQSTPKQVLKNCESAVNQRALRGRLLDMGWRKDQTPISTARNRPSLGRLSAGASFIDQGHGEISQPRDRGALSVQSRFAHDRVMAPPIQPHLNSIGLNLHPTFRTSPAEYPRIAHGLWAQPL
jgi:hypothetical protein